MQKLLLLLLLLLHPFTVSFPGQPGLARYQKGKTSLDLNEARDFGVFGYQWHQLEHMQQSAPRSRQITTPTPHHSILTGRMLLCQSTEDKNIMQKVSK